MDISDKTVLMCVSTATPVTHVVVVTMSMVHVIMSALLAGLVTSVKKVIISFTHIFSFKFLFEKKMLIIIHISFITKVKT